MGEARRLLAIPGGISVGMSGEGRDGAAALHLPCMKGSDMGALEALHPSAEGGTPPTITTTLLHTDVGVLNTTGDPRPHGENMTRGTSSGVAQLEEARGLWRKSGR